ncbi:VanZ family protein [Bacillus sp. FSL K6-3431]|uniref:VanZ family protein n=1 Tax=Bacillus sp. FSL K6-3431 TaxID=2921500 RepID=UPI0030F70788
MELENPKGAHYILRKVGEHKINKKYLWLAVAIIWCVAIYLAASSPSATGGNTGILIQQLFQLTDSQAVFVNVVFRKFVHLSAYGLLAILFYNGFEQKKLWLAWLLTTIYAITDEIHQAFLPDRTGAIFDVGLDSIGALLALFGLIYIKKKQQQHMNRS